MTSKEIKFKFCKVMQSPHIYNGSETQVMKNKDVSTMQAKENIFLEVVTAVPDQTQLT